MNRYVSALWDLKLRVDAYNEHDEEANKAFRFLTDALNRLEAFEKAAAADDGISAEELSSAIDFLRRHLEVQPHPDTFFYREYPERILIDLRYMANTDSWSTPIDLDKQKENNDGYNLCKRVFGLPEYKELR